MNNSQPNKRQLEWREWVRDQGCCLGYPGSVEIHHVIGRSGKHLKVSIGHEFILPVTNAAHREVARMGVEVQKGLFVQLVADYYSKFHELPFAPEKLLAIWSYHR